MSKALHQILFYVLVFLTALSSHGQKTLYKPLAIEFNNKAVDLMVVQDYDSALFYLNQAIKVDSSYYVAYGNKSSIYCTLKDFRKALVEVQRQISAKPDLAEAWTFGGILFDKLGDTINAILYYKKSIEIFDARIKNTNDKKYLDANKMNRAVSLILMWQEQVGRNEFIKLKESYPHGEFLNELIKLDKKAYINQILND